MHHKFLEAFKPLLMSSTEEILAGALSTRKELQDLQVRLWHEFKTLLDQTTSMDTTPRFLHVFKLSQPTILDVASAQLESISLLKKWTACCSDRAIEQWEMCRDEYCTRPDASPFLGVASCRTYQYMRNELSIPFLRSKDLINLEPASTFDSHECQPKKSEDPGNATLRPQSQPNGKQGDTEEIEEPEHVAEEQESTGLAPTPMQANGLDHCQTSQIERKVHANSNKPEKTSNTVHPKGARAETSPTAGSYASVI